jgi:hypothetical protein
MHLSAKDVKFQQAGQNQNISGPCKYHAWDFKMLRIPQNWTMKQ